MRFEMQRKYFVDEKGFQIRFSSLLEYTGSCLFSLSSSKEYKSVRSL